MTRLLDSIDHQVSIEEVGEEVFEEVGEEVGDQEKSFPEVGDLVEKEGGTRRCSANGLGMSDLEDKQSGVELPETLSTEAGRKRARDSLQQITQSMSAASALLLVLPTGLDDKEASEKWKSVSKHIQSMERALAQSKMKDDEVVVKINNAIKQWERINQRLIPCCTTPGMRLAPKALEMHMNKLKEISQELGEIYAEIKESMQEQDFDPTDLYEMFPSDVSEVTKEKLFTEIHKIQADCQVELDRLEDEENAQLNELTSHRMNLAAETANWHMLVKEEQEVEKQENKIAGDIDQIEESLAAVKKRKVNVREEAEKLRLKAAMDLQEKRLWQQKERVERRFQHKNFLTEQRRILEKKILGHTGSQARKIDPLHIVFVLDKSFSMEGMAWDTLLKGFNAFIAHRKGSGKNDFISVVLFHDREECIVSMQALQTASISLPPCPRWGGTHFSAGFRGAAQQAKAGKGQVGQTVVVFMTDGCTDRDDVQAASIAAKEIHQECSGNVITFGVPLGSCPHVPSIERIVKEGNGGKLDKQVGDATVGFVLPATQIQLLTSMFDTILVHLESMEQDFIQKLKWLDHEEEELKEKADREIEEMEKLFDKEAASQEARLKDLAGSTAGDDTAVKALKEELKMLQDEEASVKTKRVKIDERKRDMTNILTACQRQVDAAMKRSEKFEKIKEQKEQEIGKEIKEKENHVRKHHNYQVKEAEKHKGQLGTIDPERMHTLRNAVDNFASAKRELTVQLNRKSLSVLQLKDNLETFVDEMEEVLGDKGKLFNFKPVGKAMMLENYFDSHNINLNLMQGRDIENFQKVAFLALGGDAAFENNAEIENVGLSMVCSSKLRLQDCVRNDDTEGTPEAAYKKTVKSAFKAGGFEKIIKMKAAEKYKVKCMSGDLVLYDDAEILRDELEKKIDTLKEEEDEVEGEEKAALKAEMKRVKNEFQHLKSEVRVQEKKNDKYKEELEEEVTHCLMSLVAALDKPLEIFEDLFAKRQVKKILKWAEEGFIGTASTYQQLTDGICARQP